MKTTALLVAVALTFASVPAAAAESGTQTTARPRGALTGLGLGFLVAGLAGTGLGLGALANAAEADQRLVSYRIMAPVEAEASNVALLRTRVEDNTTLSALGFSLGGALLVASVVFLVLDGLGAPAAVTFMPTAQGGVFTFSTGF